MAADAAGDRRHHMGELDIELGRLQRAFGLHLGGVRRLQGLAALVDDGFGDGAGLDQGQARGRVRAWQAPPWRAHPTSWPSACTATASNGRGVDHVKQIAGVDDGAVAEFDAGDEAADAGADLDLLDRLEPSGEFVPVGDGALDRLRDRDGRRRGAACCGGLSPQADSASASSGVNHLRLRGERHVGPRRQGRTFQLLSCSQTPSPVSTSLMDESRRGTLAEATDVIGSQSRQEAAGIKHNRYASA